MGDEHGSPPLGALITPRSGGRRVLFLFSGPASRSDGLAAELLRLAGISTDEADILNEHLDDQDILDDAVWGRVRQRLAADVYGHVFASPPCRTFSELRGFGPGPVILRDWDYPYGFPKSHGRSRGLDHKDFELIRTDNLLAERTAEACSLVYSLGGSYGVEQPFPWKGSVHMFVFASFKELVGQGARLTIFDQCRYGADVKKPTQILFNGLDLSSLDLNCNHDYAHRSYAGVRDNRTGKFASSALSAYPAVLNTQLAKLIVQGWGASPDS